MEETADEIRRLQGCINDLVSVLAIPAIWSAREPAQIANTLLDVLLRMLRLDFAYARLKDPIGGVPIEMARLAQSRNLTRRPQEIGKALNPWLEDNPKKWPLLVRNPIGEGDVSIVPLRLGLQDKIGIIVAGSQRTDFPAETERLLLRVAANQAAIALQEARTHDELEGLVAARTRELAGANESLHRSETYLAEAQRLSHTGSWSFNVATREILHWSQEHFRIFGFDPEDGMPSFEKLMQRIHPDDRASAAEVIERGVRERTDYEQNFRIVLPDGTTRYIHATGHPVFNSSGDPVEFMGTVVDVTESKRAEEARARQASVRADVSASLSKPAHLGEILQGAAEAIVRHFDAALARIWTLNKEENLLELQASAGMYTHLDGPHSRIQFGELKIGLIAQEKRPYLTNDVLNDPRVSDKVWARNEGMVSFAGYPLIVQDRVGGVMAMFARQRLSAATLDALASIADSIAQGIE
jgi:PAS domain S-box-containing protein